MLVISRALSKNPFFTRKNGPRTITHVCKRLLLLRVVYAQT